MSLSNAVGGGAQDFKFGGEYQQAGSVSNGGQNLDAIRDEEGRDVVFKGENNSPSQKWTIVYEDEAADMKTTGKSEYFGLDFGRNFYIASGLPMERVVTSSGSSLTQTDLMRNQINQQFFLDGITKTIKSVKNKELSITIVNNGKGPQLKLAKTNARWW